MALRIGFVALPRSPDDSRLIHEAQALADRGHDVTVFALGALHLPTGSPVRVASIGSGLPLRLGLRTLAVARFVIEAGARLLQAHLESRFDVLIVRLGGELVLLDAVAPRLAGAKLVLELEPGAERGKHPARLRALAVAADAVITSSEAQYRAVLDAGVPAYALSIVRDAPDACFAARAQEPRFGGQGPLRVVMHGPSRPALASVVLPAFAEARKAEPRLSLRLLTEGGGWEGALADAQRLGLGADAFELAPGLAPPAVARALAEAHLGIALGEDPQILPEGLVECLSVGLPVIALRVAWAGSEMEPRDIERVEPGDARGLTEAILRLAHDRDRRAALASAAEAWRDEFGLAKQMSLFLRAIDHTCAEKLLAERRARQAAIDGVKTGSRKTPANEPDAS
ncbi:MAG: hypothetical protein IT384_06205 [Deltaproteobacteria bacterium]|nr:hypothetical protein [Deltaproteobacteria bacterium]